MSKNRYGLDNIDDEVIEELKNSGSRFVIIDGELITEDNSEYNYIFSDQDEDYIEELNFDVD